MSLISDAKGETAALIASVDWLTTPVGPPALWPQSLRTAVSLLLESTFPMLLCWGPEFTQFYNDPFRRILGAAKHPAIGKSARVTFAETWHILSPLLDRVMAGDAVDHDDMFTPLDRQGFLEECYFTYSYSPVRAEGDAVAGVFVTCTETTGRVVGERRLRLLQELAAESTTADPVCVCRGAAEVMARGAADLPFALLYLFDDERATLRYVAGTGPPGAAVIPAVVHLSAGTAAPWPLERSLAAGALIVDDDPSAPSGPVFVTPICATPGIAAGVLVAGASSTLRLDDGYRGFVTLVAREIGASLAQAQAQALEHEKQRVASNADRVRSTILVVVDDADMREDVARLLGERWIVETAADGEAALAAARICHPALVVTDVVMPRLDGFGLLRALRADASTRDIPVVLLSEHAAEEAHIEALEADANDYVVKPFSAGELRARVEAQLLRSEIRAIRAAHDRQLAEVFRHAPVAVALLRGSEHVFDFANDEYISVVGRADLVGKRIADALPELAEEGLVALLDDVYAAGQPYTASSVPLTLNSGTGGTSERTYYNFAYQPLRNHGGAVEGIAVTAVEVTALIEARNEADAANRAKDQFLAVLGHELRAPLGPILTAVRLLELKGSPDPDMQKLRQTIERQALHMQRLIEDLLDVGRIISGKLRLEKNRVDLATLVAQAVEAASPVIERRRHTITVVKPANPVYVDVDAARFTQVLWNLLNNAAKFMSEGGGIELSLEEAAGKAIVRVRDHGIGIAPEMLERVFDRFVQASPDDMTSDGLGIGLAVARTIVERHGGTIVARSEGAGMGSDFTVIVPAAQGAGSATGAETS